MRLARLNIDNGIAGTEQTLVEMFRLVVDGAIEPALMQFTDAAVGRTPARRERTLIKKVANAWIRNVVIREDPARHEFIRSPTQTLARGAGDCDDLVVAVSSSLEYLGFPVEMVVVSDSPLGADEFTHVYLRAWLPMEMRWLAVDPRAMAEFGWPIGREVSPAAVTAMRAYGFDEETNTLIIGRSQMNGVGRLGQADAFRDIDIRDPLEGQVSATGGAPTVQDALQALQQADTSTLTADQQQLLQQGVEAAQAQIRANRLQNIFLAVGVVSGVVTIGSVLFRRK